MIEKNVDDTNEQLKFIDNRVDGLEQNISKLENLKADAKALE